LCVDGEAIDSTYVLLGCSNGQNIYSAGGLGTEAIFDFLFVLETDELWLYGMEYDINQWLYGGGHGLTLEDMRQIYETRTHYTRWHGYGICHIPRKHLSISRVHDGIKRVIHCHDLYSFYQTSFLKWIEAEGLATNQAERDCIERMKRTRGDWSLESIESVREYNAIELRLLQAGVARFKKAVVATSYTPARWYSAGSLAEAAFIKHSVAAHLGDDTEYPPPLREAIERAYYGGRIEIGGVGIINRPIYAYDMNSAYPTAMLTLPSLRYATWERVQHPDMFYGAAMVCHAKVTSKRNGSRRVKWGALPYRTDHALYYPMECTGWYWSDELIEAQVMADVSIDEAWVLCSGGNTQPFAYLADLYFQRQVLKNSGNPAQQILKLIMNSSYGKLAQRPRAYIDEKGETQSTASKWRSIAYAGMITAAVRARILQAIAQSPGDIVSINTDAIYSTSKLNLPIGHDLGQWSYAVYEWMNLWQPGFYTLPSELGAITKRTRGFNATTVDHEAILSAWMNGWDAATIIERVFYGYVSAVLRSDVKWCDWQTIEHKLSFQDTRRHMADVSRTHTHYIPSFALTRAEVTIADTLESIRWGGLTESEFWRRQKALDAEQPQPGELAE